MLDYIEIKEICIANTEATEGLIEDQVYYAVEREDLERKLDRRLSKYKKTIRKFNPADVRKFQMQYFAHKVFKRKGLINKHLNHSRYRYLDELDRGFLEHWANYPWKFSFSIIYTRPFEDFFEMEDVFSGDRFLLYSPGMTASLAEHGVALWFILIAFNGSCWQTYGLIGALQGFQLGDIHYYTALLRPDQWPISGPDILVNVERNPVPYFLLLSASNYPLTFHGDDQLVRIVAEYDYDSIDLKGMEKHFDLEREGDLIKFGLKGWSAFPHFATAYFDENEKFLKLSAMTDRSFEQLITQLNQLKYDLPSDPDFRVNMAMQQTGKEILNRDFLHDEYEDLFTSPTSIQDEETMQKLSMVMDLLVPEVNAERIPDFEDIARKAGVELQIVVDLARELIKKIKGAS